MESDQAKILLEEEEHEYLLERETVKKLEARLAGHEVNENESMLLGKLCTLAPRYALALSFIILLKRIINFKGV